jgi:hypothetical protein
MEKDDKIPKVVLVDKPPQQKPRIQEVPYIYVDPQGVVWSVYFNLSDVEKPTSRLH